MRGTQVRKLPKSLWKTKTLRHVLGDGLVFPRSTGELKLMQTLETVTIHNILQDEHRRCKPSSSDKRGRKQSGLRFLHRLGIVEMDKCKKEDLQVLFMDLGDHLESLSLFGKTIPMELFDGTMLSAAAGARLRHVGSLELDGELQPPHCNCNPCDESPFHSCLPRHLSNLTRLVLRRTKVKQEFIHVVANLPILLELEMHNESYQGEELTLCDSHGFTASLFFELPLWTPSGE